MSQLLLNDDGTVTIPLRPVIGAEGSHERAPLVLPEPSLEQLAAMHAIARAVDESLPELIQIGDPREATAEELGAATKRINERNQQTFSSEMPYGHALIAIIEMLLPGTHVGMADLPPWCGHPATINHILTHFQTPLVG